MRLLALAATLAMLGLPPPAQAADKFVSGNWWLQPCRQMVFDCVVYVSGVVDGMEAAGQKFFCVPRDVTNGQLWEVAVNYLNRHPAELHHPFSFLIAYAMKEAFPCRASKPGN